MGYGFIAQIVAVILGISLLVGFGEWHGRKSVQESWDASIAKQAIQSASSVIESARNAAAAESKLEKASQAQQNRTRIVTKEVVRYEASPIQKCMLNPEFVASFNYISSLLDADSIGMPPSSSTTGAPLELSEAAVTDAAVLRAYEAAIVELAALWQSYEALSSWVRSSYRLASKGAGQPEP